jgi:hypothetical protein
MLNGGRLRRLSLDESYSAKQISTADAVYLDALRAVVDQWIDSGIDAAGIESPLTRNVSTVPSGYSHSLYEILADWFPRNTPVPKLMDDGTIIVVALPLRPRLGAATPWIYARDCAILDFQDLLETSGSHKLARCANQQCRRYYLRNRLRANVIKRGTYCHRCIGVGSHVRTKASRDKHKLERIMQAAKFWPLWGQAARREAQPEWVARQMNKAAGRQTPVTRKWVSQNRSLIEAELKRRNNAGS